MNRSDPNSSEGAPLGPSSSTAAQSRTALGRRVRPEQRERHGDPLPSFVQQRLWYLYQVESEPAVYNVPAAYRLTGSLHVPVLRHAIEEIVRRHEALRTTFSFSGGSPVQRIHPPKEIELPWVDLSMRSALAAEREAQAALAAEARKPFDLAAGPLVRWLLVRVRPADHVLLVVAHHTVIDGWSLDVLWRELAVLYGALRAGAPSPLPELALQYADFALWQREAVQGERLERQLAYWRQRLAGPLPVLDLPADLPRPPVQTYRGDAVPFAVPAALTQALAAIGRRENATLFMVLLAAFKVLLHRLTGQDDLIVGAAVASRRTGVRAADRVFCGHAGVAHADRRGRVVSGGAAERAGCEPRCVRAPGGAV
jgi:hypothetical protein